MNPPPQAETEKQRMVLTALLRKVLVHLEAGEVQPGLLLVAVHGVSEVDATHFAVDATTALLVDETPHNVIVTNYLLNICGELATKLATNLGNFNFEIAKGTHHVH